ncbi:hypothetical protein GGF50DRAFT_64546, partial [Schizophyllum commune]
MITEEQVVRDKEATVVQTRRQREASARTEEATPADKSSEVAGEQPTSPRSGKESWEALPFKDELIAADPWTLPTGVNPSAQTRDARIDDEQLPEGHLLLAMDPVLIKQFKEGYLKDEYFKTRYGSAAASPETELTPAHYRTGRHGLLYFFDADWNAKLCVLRSMVRFVLTWLHESSNEAAHGG